MDDDRRLLTVKEEESRQRLDRFLAGRFPSHSRSYLQKLIREGRVRLVSGPPPGPGGARPLAPGRAVARGDRIVVTFPPPETLHLAPEPMPLEILHEDSQILVLSKPAGVVVHPGAGARSGTLVHALLHHCRDLSGIGGVERPGIVHRLDKGTSGVMVVAKSDAAHRDLVRQFQARAVTKIYVALVWGRLTRGAGVIDVAIGRDVKRRVRISPRTASPREALTEYRVLEALAGFSWLEVRPRTGRTHQIRVHLGHIGHPVVGDAVYGGGRSKEVVDPARRRALEGLGRLALHARRISFTHPGTGRQVSFESPVPPEIEELIMVLREP